MDLRDREKAMDERWSGETRVWDSREAMLEHHLQRARERESRLRAALERYRGQVDQYGVHSAADALAGGAEPLPGGTPLEEYIAELEKDPERKARLEAARVRVREKLRDAVPADDGLVEVGEIVQIEDGMDTRLVDWQEARWTMKAGDKLYARRAVQPAARQCSHSPWIGAACPPGSACDNECARATGQTAAPRLYRCIHPGCMGVHTKPNALCL